MEKSAERLEKKRDSMSNIVESVKAAATAVGDILSSADMGDQTRPDEPAKDDGKDLTFLSAEGATVVPPPPRMSLFANRQT